MSHTAVRFIWAPRIGDFILDHEWLVGQGMSSVKLRIAARKLIRAQQHDLLMANIDGLGHVYLDVVL